MAVERESGSEFWKPGSNLSQRRTNRPVDGQMEKARKQSSRLTQAAYDLILEHRSPSKWFQIGSFICFNLIVLAKPSCHSFSSPFTSCWGPSTAWWPCHPKCCRTSRKTSHLGQWIAEFFPWMSELELSLCRARAFFVF